MNALIFKVQVPEVAIQHLKQKLALSDFPSEVAGTEPWVQGPPVDTIKRLADVWQNSFDWRKAEAHLNTFPQYIAPIEVSGFGTFDVHFIHKRSPHLKAIPLLFLHGWPGSFIEVTKIIDGLQGPGDVTFHVVAPSLIDFGFSSGSSKGFQFEQHAETYHNLMVGLGYDQYAIQGGDVGGVVSRFIAMKYGPHHCKAYHTNSPLPGEPNAESHPEIHAKLSSTPLTASELEGLQRAAVFSQEGSGYFKQQSTRPLTIGYALKDSPLALLAWLYEKLHDWSDEYPWTDEEILTWISIYYFSTAGPHAASNVYYAIEHRNPTAFVASQSFVDVPLGISIFLKDLVRLPKLWNHTLGPIAFENEHQKGGHFAAWERPDDVVADLQIMFKEAATFGFTL